LKELDREQESCQSINGRKNLGYLFGKYIVVNVHYIVVNVKVM